MRLVTGGLLSVLRKATCVVLRWASVVTSVRLLVWCSVCLWTCVLNVGSARLSVVSVCRWLLSVMVSVLGRVSWRCSLVVLRLLSMCYGWCVVRVVRAELTLTEEWMMRMTGSAAGVLG